MKWMGCAATVHSVVPIECWVASTACCDVIGSERSQMRTARPSLKLFISTLWRGGPQWLGKSSLQQKKKVLLATYVYPLLLAVRSPVFYLPAMDHHGKLGALFCGCCCRWVLIFIHDNNLIRRWKRKKKKKRDEDGTGWKTASMRHACPFWHKTSKWYLCVLI